MLMGGPFEPDVGLSGAVLQSNIAFLWLVSVFLLPTRTPSRLGWWPVLCALCTSWPLRTA